MAPLHHATFFLHLKKNTISSANGKDWIFARVHCVTLRGKACWLRTRESG